MKNRLAEFVYLDDVSVNNYLASLGEGIPAEITRQTAQERRKILKALANIFQVGQAGGGYETADTDSSERKLTLLAPYHFRDLHNIVNKNSSIGKYPSNKISDLSDANPGDVVEITGTIHPMAPFIFEMVIISGIKLREEIENKLDEIPPSEDIPLHDLLNEGPFDTRDPILFGRNLSNQKIALRMKHGEHTLAIPLSREHLRTDPFLSFQEPRTYTVYGRVESFINERWYPLQPAGIYDRFMPTEEMGEQYINSLQELGEDMEMEITNDDLYVDEPGVLVRPIAIYW